jgi:membrane protease YdiL (CAAX protease family)
MDPSPIFLLPDGRLRAGWRLLLFLVFYVVTGALSAGLLSRLREMNLLAFAAGVRIAGTVATTWLMMRLFDRQPFLAVGLRVSQGKWRELGSGLVAGVVLVEAAIVCEWATGLVTIQYSDALSFPVGWSLVSATLVLVVGAAAEELLFRGYPFQRLVEGTGGLSAIAISSLLFGWLHVGNPSATTLSVINTMLAGILLSVAYLRTRALWFPIGIHFAWNWSMALSGFPVSGINVVDMPWRAIPSSSAIWLHGGDYGPEGGVIATSVLLVGIAWLVIRMPKDAGEESALPPAAAAGESG